jgi:hypothetical protein
MFDITMREEMQKLKYIPMILVMLLSCGFSQPADIPEEVSKDNILYQAKSTGGFNNCEYEYKGNTVVISAKDSTDPGVYFERINKDTSNLKYFTFAIKGKLLREGQWCFPVVQIYDEKDDEYTPSITKTSFSMKEDEYTIVTVPFDGKIKKLFKIQFLLVTDKGSWDIEVKDPKLE